MRQRGRGGRGEGGQEGGGGREGAGMEGRGVVRQSVRESVRGAHRDLLTESWHVKPQALPVSSHAGAAKPQQEHWGSQSQGGQDTRDTFKAQRRGVYTVTSL